MPIKYIDSSGRYELPKGLNNVTFPNKATDRELVEWYNKYSGSTNEITRFATREIAESRCLELKLAMDQLATSAQTAKRENKISMAKKTKQENKKSAKGKKAAGKNGSGGGGRKFALLDHTLHKLVKDNPRREGTAGAKSWDAIRNGMTYRDAIDAGARNKDIRHDVNGGRLELRAPKGGAKTATAPAAKANGNGNGKKAPTKKAKKVAAKVASPATDPASAAA